jgi:hypothetical protein
VFTKKLLTTVLLALGLTYGAALLIPPPLTEARNWAAPGHHLLRDSWQLRAEHSAEALAMPLSGRLLL